MTVLELEYVPWEETAKGICCQGRSSNALVTSSQRVLTLLQRQLQGGLLYPQLLRKAVKITGTLPRSAPATSNYRYLGEECHNQNSAVHWRPGIHCDSWQATRCGGKTACRSHCTPLFPVNCPDLFFNSFKLLVSIWSGQCVSPCNRALWEKAFLYLCGIQNELFQVMSMFGNIPLWLQMNY